MAVEIAQQPSRAGCAGSRGARGYSGTGSCGRRRRPNHELISLVSRNSQATRGNLVHCGRRSAPHRDPPVLELQSARVGAARRRRSHVALGDAQARLHLPRQRLRYLPTRPPATPRDRHAGRRSVSRRVPDWPHQRNVFSRSPYAVEWRGRHTLCRVRTRAGRRSADGQLWVRRLRPDQELHRMGRARREHLAALLTPHHGHTRDGRRVPNLLRAVGVAGLTPRRRRLPVRPLGGRHAMQALLLLRLPGGHLRAAGRPLPRLQIADRAERVVGRCSCGLPSRGRSVELHKASGGPHGGPHRW
mmetsp:Transcript_36927/g.101916  ORF Transcript_36927/g.101916 Transcript_36927/m.101916 type:complete len:302 (-) Transcript_36927:462-1367(-)